VAGPRRTEINGRVEPGWEKVRDAFAANFDEYSEVGASFCLYHQGRPVVDLAGGWVDGEAGTPYTHQSLQNVFSTTKGATAICAHLLVQRGLLDLDAPVSSYWPEFAAAGKADVPVRMLLCHQVGLPTIDARLTLEQVCAVTPVVEALADQAPYWEPGTAHGYHALTYGWLVGEVVRRIDGRSVGRFFAEEIAAPLGLDFWIGLPEAEEPRVAPLLPMVMLGERPDPSQLSEQDKARMAAMMSPDSLILRALSLNGAVDALGAGENPFNTRAVHATEMPAANGMTNGASLARLYASTIGELDGVRILEDKTVDAARRTHAKGDDKVLLAESHFGAGFMLDGVLCPLLSSGSYGHPGAGGSLGFADPEAGIAFGYVMNQMATGIAGDPRNIALIEAVRACL
jgi:CubicO group peptidase (beta-lactamase class C family)